MTVDELSKELSDLLKNMLSTYYKTLDDKVNDYKAKLYDEALPEYIITLKKLCDTLPTLSITSKETTEAEAKTEDVETINTFSMPTIVKANNTTKADTTNIKKTVKIVKNNYTVLEKKKPAMKSKK